MKTYIIPCLHLNSSLTSAITITQDVFLFARYAACLEKAMVSVERIRDYEDITQEVPEEEIQFTSHSMTEWTTLEATSLINSRRIDKRTLSTEEGCDTTDNIDNYVVENKNDTENHKGPSLAFDNVTCRYPGSYGKSSNEAITLRNVSFSLFAGEKIGVVGRTGAGKSSLILAIYRLLEQVEGEIQFDGVDINSLKLERHRSRITMIPQVFMVISVTDLFYTFVFIIFQEIRYGKTLIILSPGNCPFYWNTKIQS